ncbi:MAG: DUF4159 domain-containing protein [Methylocystaceae bacterium]|nr:DUF4159 domain-containing protein [Methylocystaceae bacterium]
MGWFEQLSFATPWALSAMLVLPMIWQLLRVTPPKPSVIRFPAVRLLQELTTTQQLATKTPWWIILLRSLIILCLILALGQPMLNHPPQTDQSDGPLVIIVDNDWSVMDRWQDRRLEINKLIQQAKATDRLILLIPTAQEYLRGFHPAADHEKAQSTLTAHPWPGDRNKVLTRLHEDIKGLSEIPTIQWISNGLKNNTDDNEFASNLHQLGDLEIISEPTTQGLSALAKVKRHADGFDITITTTRQMTQDQQILQVLDEKADVLFQKKIDLDAQKQTHDVTLDLPLELRNRVDSFRLNNRISPAAVYLLDEKWRDRPVGIIDHQNRAEHLLDPNYYIHKSLKPHAPLISAKLDQLLSRGLSLIFQTEPGSMSADEVANLLNWINKGGVFIQFADPQLSQDPSNPARNLLPITLLQGERTLGGTLSWKQSAKLAAFPANSPFNGLNIPDDIQIKKQMLARPETRLAEKTWAQLEDGTPLITAEKQGKGWRILFHVKAVPGWSNLPLSGMFELMMMRLLSLSDGTDFQQRDQALPPYRLFDQNGSLVAPYGNVSPLKNDDSPVSAENPPGLYGPENGLHAFNLGPKVAGFETLSELPLGVVQRGFIKSQPQNLTPWVLFLAFILALIDWLLALTWLRRPQAVAALFLIACLTPCAKADTDWDKALLAANEMRLAYLVTGHEETDETTRRGLDGLAAVLRRRTAVELGPSMAFHPEKDDPSLFPMIYWPIIDAQKSLSTQAAERLNNFLNTGGFLLIDTLGQKRPGKLANLSDKLQIGELQKIPDTHVLTRSFYLMKDFPGRYDLGDVWVEASNNSMRDGVSSVLIGNNAWSEAWARDENLRPLYPVIPGDEIQREQAYRFGVNLVMYILSGNYKGDQVHLPAILQRLGL